MPKDKCIICGKPCVGRYCYRHLAEILDREAELSRTDPAQYIANVNAANQEGGVRVPPVKLHDRCVYSTTFKF